LAATNTNGNAKQQNSRAIAARLLQQLQQGRSLSELFEHGLKDASPRDVGLVKELCFGVARWWPRLEAITVRLVRKPLKPRDADIKALIMIGLHQLLHMRVASHAALAETVEAAKLLQKPWAAGLINAVLRRFQREQADILEDIDAISSARYAHPEWLLGELQRAWPEQWQAVVEANNEHPPMSLRVNCRRLQRQQYFEQLQQLAIPARPIPGTSSGLVLDRPLDAAALPGLGDGLVSIQDGAAQLAAPLLEVQPGDRVLDACAAPGGKSGHLLEIAPPDVSVTALDISAERLQRVADNLQRLGLSATLAVGDMSAPAGDWSEQLYDRILLDAPCSASGVIRRHPDIKLLRKPTDIARLAAAQSTILESAWQLLAPGGLLLYATCSVLPQENQQQISAFLRRHPQAQERPLPITRGQQQLHGRQILPGEATMDGFYYAALSKAD